MAGKKRVIQRHHISETPEVTVDIFQGEHKILTNIQWWCRKTVSKGFITALKVFIALNEDRAVELIKEN